MPITGFSLNAVRFVAFNVCERRNARSMEPCKNSSGPCSEEAVPGPPVPILSTGGRKEHKLSRALKRCQYAGLVIFVVLFCTHTDIVLHIFKKSMTIFRRYILNKDLTLKQKCYCEVIFDGFCSDSSVSDNNYRLHQFIQVLEIRQGQAVLLISKRTA